jgi:hypothetical protein
VICAVGSPILLRPPLQGTINRPGRLHLRKPDAQFAYTLFVKERKIFGRGRKTA